MDHVEVSNGDDMWDSRALKEARRSEEDRDNSRHITVTTAQRKINVYQRSE